MSRALLRQMTPGVLLLFALVTGITLLIGHLLPPAPLAVFISITPDYSLRIARVDTRQRTVAVTSIDDVLDYPYTIDSRCRILYTVQIGPRSALAYASLITGEHHTYFDEYNGGYAEWLPDGRHLWTQFTTGPNRAPHYAVIDTVTNQIQPVALEQHENSPPLRLAWSPNSAYGLLYGWRDARVMYAYLLDIATGALTPVPVSQNQAFLWSPDSRYLGWLDLKQGIAAPEIAALTRPPQHSGEIHYGLGMAWSPDNRLLFIARPENGPDFQSYAWEPRTAVVVATGVRLPVTDVSYRILPAPWSPDGTRLYYEDPQNKVHILDVATGQELAALDSPDYDGYRTHAWSPDSRYLVSYNSYPPAFVFTEIATRRSTSIDIDAGSSTFAAFVDAWQHTSEPGIFERTSSTLGRILWRDNVPVYQPDIRIPGAYLGAYCDPEANA